MVKTGEQLGHYRIVSKIGAGGMGEVYLAEDTKLDRKVALKILPPEFAKDKDRMNRFVREAKSASALNHPNIITIHEIGESDKTHFIATEFIDGKTLSEYAKANPLDFKSILEIAIQTASALDEAHTAGIVHRDIKPDNLMIRASGLVKILDFGIAKLSTPFESDGERATAIKGTSAGMIIGTANYMSPEQAAGKMVDARSDIFSFGVVLYEMITGKLPFAGETAMEMIGAILKDEPPPLGVSVPDELKRIVGKCLRKNLSERYQTIKDVCADLKEFKQELEFQDKLERTNAPNRAERKTQILKAQTTAEENPKSAIRNLKSVVVLPFTNIGADAEDDYFSDGLTEEIISDLSNIRSLRVISRNSAMKLKGASKDLKTITEELNVRYILDGSVRKAGHNFRISVQLIDGISDANLWAEKYSGSLDDIFDIQESVSRSIAEALKITLTTGEIEQIEARPIEDARAYDLYLRARAKFMQGSPAALDRSIELLKQGLEIIGDNELLYAALGYTYYFYFKWISKLNENFLRLANECMEKVFALNPDSTHGFNLKGFFSYSEGSVAEAVRALKRAVEIEPTNAEALLWLTIYSQYFEGNRAEALRYADEVRRIDPLLPANTMIRGFVEIYSGNFGAEALSWIERGFEMDSSAPLSNWLATIGKAWCGKTDEAVAHAERLAEIAPGWVYTEHALFFKHALRGEKDAALAHYTPDFEKEAEHDCHFALHIAHCFALIHEKEKALDFLETSVRKGMLNYSFIGKYDPLLENIRGEQRFKDLIEKAKKLSAQIKGKSADLEIQNEPEETGTLIFEAQATAEKSPAATTGSEDGFWVAVLPFKYRGANADLEALAEGLSEEIITGLSRFPYLQVIARSSTARFSTAEFADVRSIGTQLGVRYVLEGSLRQSGASLRLTTQLVEMTTGKHLWAETYDRAFQSVEIFAIQDELVPRIVSTIADQHGVLVHSITDAIRRKDKNQITPSEAVMRVFNFHERMTPEEHSVVRYLLESVASDFPNEGNVWAMLETLYCDEYMFGFNPRPDPLGRALAAAQRAVQNAPTSNLACQSLAQAHFFRRELEAFRPLAERTIALNPMDGATLAFMGVLIACSGEWERGCQVTEQAMRLNPHFPGWYRLAVLFDAYRRSDYRAALNEAQRINIPNYFWKLVLCAAANAQLGEFEKAREALKELLAARPDFTKAAPAEFGRWFDSELVEHLMDGLRKAGLEMVSASNFEEQKTQISNAQTAPEELPSEGKTQNSIAVLPFTNISADEENEYFCDGLAEELLNALSKIENLRVAARTSAFSFKGKNAEAREIGRALNVNTVLEGSVRRSGNRLRISVQLVNAANGFQLWSERYDREMRDIFDVQDEIALAVVDALKLKLFGDEKEAILKRYTDNAQAYELYLKGRFFWSKLSPAGFTKAIEYFKQAVLIEPDFALAYAGLADSYAILSQVSAVPVSETMPKAREFAEKAISLDADLSEAHTSLGLVLADYDYDFVAAERHYKTAIRLNPNNSTAHQLYAQLLAQLGRHEEAEAEFRESIKVDPLSVLINWQYGFGLFQARRYDESIIQLNKTSEMDSSFPLTQWLFACIHQAQGNYPEAAESFAKFYELAGNSEDAVRIRKSFADGGWTGFVRMMTGAQRPADVTGYFAAVLHASLGEKDAAFTQLEKAYDNREAILSTLITNDPRVDSLRDDPRFTELLNCIGFPPEKPFQTDESLEAQTVTLKPTAAESKQPEETAEGDSKPQRADAEPNSEQTINPKPKIQNPKSKWWLFGLLGLLVLIVGFFGYKYFSPSTKQINSIAVLPFENKSSDADTDYLSDGLAESLIYRLSQIPNLKVSPTSSVFRYKGKQTDPQAVAKELGVDSVMTGRIAQRGDQLTISVNLIDARNDKSLWGEQYERRMSDLLATQREIAAEITNNLKLKLSGEGEQKLTKKYTDNNEAYQLYLKGRFYWAKRTKDDILKAIDYYRQAIALDPNFALAYVGIADAYNSMGKDPDAAPKETIPLAKSSAMKALEIDPTQSEAHAALGDSLAIYDWYWKDSEREFSRAIELNPNIAYTHVAHATSYLAAQGRADEVVAELERAVEIEPLSLINNSILVTGYLYARQNDKALGQARKAFDLDPNFLIAHQWLALAYIANGRYDDAVKIGEDGLRLSPSSPEMLFVIADAYAKQGRRREAGQYADRIREIAKTRYVRTYWLACIYAALGERDKAFAELEQSFADKDIFLPRMRIDPMFDSLRDDPRYKDLLRRLNLPE